MCLQTRISEEIEGKTVLGYKIYRKYKTGIGAYMLNNSGLRIAYYWGGGKISNESYNKPKSRPDRIPVGEWITASTARYLEYEVEREPGAAFYYAKYPSGFHFYASKEDAEFAAQQVTDFEPVVRAVVGKEICAVGTGYDYDKRCNGSTGPKVYVAKKLFILPEVN